MSKTLVKRVQSATRKYAKEHFNLKGNRASRLMNNPKGTYTRKMIAARIRTGRAMTGGRGVKSLPSGSEYQRLSNKFGL